MAQSWEVTARVEAAQGDYAAAQERLARVLVRFDELGYPWGAAEAATTLAKVELQAGDLDAAYARAVEAVRRWEAIDEAGRSDGASQARHVLANIEES